MFERYVSDYGFGGGDMTSAGDGGVLLFFQERQKSGDQGQSSLWTKPRESPPNVSVSRLSDGRLLGVSHDPRPDFVQAAGLNGSTYSVSFSEDDGETWTAPQGICSTPGCYYIHNDRILELSGGRILIPANRVPEESFGKEIETSDQSGAFYSDDGGKTWNESNWISAALPGDHLAESIAVELPDGRVKAFMRCTTGYMRQSVSEDGGASWQQETATQLRMPCAPFTVRQDPFTGWYFAVWIRSFPAPQYQYPRSPLCLALSRDGTETWQFLCELENNPMHSYGYPTLHFTEDFLLTAYYENNRGREYNSAAHRVKLRGMTRAEALGVAE